MSTREAALGTAQGAPNRRAAGPKRAPRAVSGARLSDERGQRSERDSRESAEREDDFILQFQDAINQSVLPDLPPIPGYHVCWLTTTNPRDSIPNRLRMGYELIKGEEFPSFAGMSCKTGDYAGVIAVNEMVAARVPLNRYNAIMRHLHDTLPRDEQEKLADRTKRIKEELEQAGSAVDEEGDGTASLSERARSMPAFES